MMRYRKLVMPAALALHLSAALPAFAQDAPAPHLPIVRGDPGLQSHGEYIDQMVADFMTRNALPGLTLAIVQAPYIPRSSGYGRASLVHDELASTKTMWNVGPITQAFTAVAIMQLKEEDKLRLSDPVSTYVDGLPTTWQRVTLLQLMQHSSGIPDYRDQLNLSQHYTPAQLLDLVRIKPLLFNAGAEIRLSATDSTLLALVIERASGMSYHDFIWKHQIKVEGLTSTMFAADMAHGAATDRPAPQPGQNQHSLFKSRVRYINPVEPATGYQLVGGKMAATPQSASDSLYGFGDIWASAEDISTWDIGLAGETLVKDADDRDLIYSPAKLAGSAVPAMAGWEFTHHPGFMEVKGNSPGFSSYLSRFTAADELVCVTLLTNKEGVDLTVLARQIAEAYKPGLGAPVDQHQVVAQESKYGTAVTVARIKAALAKAKTPIFAVVDHAANAEGAGEKLRPTTVITFGNPKAGTKLMQADQVIGLDLPLRLIVWKDDIGRTWIAFTNADAFVARYGIKDTGTIIAMNRFVEGIIQQAANVYTY